MVAWQEGTVEANGLRLHYTRTGGDKTPMVMVHGLTDNGLAWTRLARELEHFFDIIMIDARGHGLSDKPETGYAAQDHVRDVAAVIQALQIEKPIVIGHSMGGVTVSWLCAEYPELVRAAILEDPVWRWPSPSETNSASKRTAYESWRQRLEYRKTLSPAESYARGRRERPLWVAEDHDADVPAKEQVALQVLEFVLHHEQNWAQQVVKFQAPVLLIYGNPALGSIVGPDVAAEARRLNPLIEPLQIASAGHSIRREQFGEYRAVVREFIARVMRTTSA